MEELGRAFTNLPPAARVALVVLVVVQLVLQVSALLDLRRRTGVRFGRKWLWLLVIIGGSVLGPILYFAFGVLRDWPAEVEALGLDSEGNAPPRWESGLEKLYRDRNREP